MKPFRRWAAPACWMGALVAAIAAAPAAAAAREGTGAGNVRAAGAATPGPGPAAIAPCLDATFHRPSVTRCSVTLDDGSALTVDTTAGMSPEQLNRLVLAADRSTVTGCPFDSRAKGLIEGGPQGDRVFVSDIYIAWFDYTLQDGNSPGTTWARSGALAGLWALDQDTRTFRYFYGPTGKGAAAAPNADGICWNWARNQLIPGSNSPRGQRYFWDTYAPPVEHTIVIGTNRASTGYSTVYAQRYAAAGSEFVQRRDGVQDWAGVHYATAALLTSANGGTTFRDPASGMPGSVRYVLDFVCRPAEIEVTWLFCPTAAATPLYVYAGLWASYAGLGEAVSQPSRCPGEPRPTAVPTPKRWDGHSTCGNDAVKPVPALVFGVPTTRGAVFHSYNWFGSSLPFTLLCQAGYVIASYPAPDSVEPFPWSDEVPCYLSYGFGTDPISQQGKVPAPPAYLGIPRGATMSLGFSQSMTGSPVLKFVNLVDPHQGTGKRDSPAAFPFQKMGVGYESSDQQQGLTLATSWPYAYTLAGGTWYVVSYSISGQ